MAIDRESERVSDVALFSWPETVDDPSVSVSVLYSFDDDRPVIMSLSFFWPGKAADGDS